MLVRELQLLVGSAAALSIPARSSPAPRRHRSDPTAANAASATLGSGGGAARQHQSLRQFSLGLLLAHRALYLIARCARCDVRLVAASSSESTERRSVVPPSPPQIGGANIGDPPTSSPSSPLGLVLASLAPLLEHGGRAIPDARSLSNRSCNRLGKREAAAGATRAVGA
jgi:hypothetical protein